MVPYLFLEGPVQRREVRVGKYVWILGCLTSSVVNTPPLGLALLSSPEPLIIALPLRSHPSAAGIQSPDGPPRSIISIYICHTVTILPANPKSHTHPLSRPPLCQNKGQKEATDSPTPLDYQPVCTCSAGRLITGITGLNCIKYQIIWFSFIHSIHSDYTNY